MQIILPPLDDLISQVEFKGSKFIANLYSNSSFDKENIKSEINSLKNIHTKASHFVYAFRYLNEFDQIVESFSDDGEPKNSSAIPMLNVLRGEELINCGVITVRYFGGVKLGIGGLVRAYGKSCKDIIKKAKKQNLISAYEKLQQYSIFVSYTNNSKAIYQLQKYDINVISQEFLETKIKITCLSKNENFLLFSKNNPMLFNEFF